MIQTNQLRVGNYLIDPREVSKDIIERFKIREDGIFKVKITDLCYASEYKGISLTPEMLEKCGAEKYEEFGKSFMELSVTTDLVIFSDETGVKLMCLGDEIKKVEYLHDLQNLYFALTNNELEINL